MRDTYYTQLGVSFLRFFPFLFRHTHDNTMVKGLTLEGQGTGLHLPAFAFLTQGGVLGMHFSGRRASEYWTKAHHKIHTYKAGGEFTLLDQTHMNK